MLLSKMFCCFSKSFNRDEELIYEALSASTYKVYNLHFQQTAEGEMCNLCRSQYEEMYVSSSFKLK